MGGRKRQNLTLDLNSASPKKNKVQNLLTSPDVQMLKLTSPELEKFLSQNPSLATPTLSSYGFPKSVTEEQMQYAKGFEEALEKIKYQDNLGPNTDTVTAANTLVTLSAGQSGQQDDESLLSPGAAGVSPIDMETQEKIKL